MILRFPFLFICLATLTQLFSTSDLIAEINILEGLKKGMSLARRCQWELKLGSVPSAFGAEWKTTRELYKQINFSIIFLARSRFQWKNCCWKIQEAVVDFLSSFFYRIEWYIENFLKESLVPFEQYIQTVCNLCYEFRYLSKLDLKATLLAVISRQTLGYSSILLNTHGDGIGRYSHIQEFRWAYKNKVLHQPRRTASRTKMHGNQWKLVTHVTYISEGHCFTLR